MILLPESIFVFSPRCRTATSFGSGGGRRLRIEQIIDGETFNAFELLDESSTLWTLRHGTRAWTRTADSGMTALYLTLSFSVAYASLVVEENS